MCHIKVLLPAHNGEHASVVFCTSFWDLTFCHQITNLAKTHVYVSFAVLFSFLVEKLVRFVFLFFWTLKFIVIVWCDRCENRSGRTWLMLSFQQCAMIETGITAAAKEESALTCDLCDLWVCVCLWVYNMFVWARTNHFMHDSIYKCMYVILVFWRFQLYHLFFIFCVYWTIMVLYILFSFPHTDIQWQTDKLKNTTWMYIAWSSTKQQGFNLLMSSNRQFNTWLSIKPLAFWHLTARSRVPLRDTSTLPTLYLACCANPPGGTTCMWC